MFSSTLTFFLLLAALLTLTTAAPLNSTFTSTSPLCTSLSIPVSVSAQNAKFPPDFTTTSLLSIVGAIGGVVFNSLVTDSYTIAAIYCEPEVYVESRRETLQVLVHGATYTKNYWTGDNYNERYSWVAAASKQGYPTLAIDRLGNGASTHADPILAIQYPLETETIHQLILQARAGRLPPPLTSRPFSSIIYAGHSYGSIIGNALAATHPTDIDVLILTGWSSSFITLIPTVLGEAVVLPARLAEPARFGGLPLGYLEISSKVGVRTLFWGGAYEEELFEYDFRNRGTLSAGEAATLAFGINTASAYTGAVFIVTGQHDAIFCNLLGLQFVLGLLGSQPECGDPNTGYLGQSRKLFPKAAVFDAYVVPNAGHCWQLHTSALQAFAIVNGWLARRGY